MKSPRQEKMRANKQAAIDKMKQGSNKPTNPAKSYPNTKDKQGFPLIGGGEGTRAPFKSGGKIKKAYKSGGSMKKCKGGC